MQTASEMKNLKSRKLYLQVYDELCKYIEVNKLGPGDHLPTEAEMTEMLGVSRNVLREAIKSLEITGVIQSKPGVGITIQRKNSNLMLMSMVNQIGDTSDEHMVSCIVEVRKALEMGFIPKIYERMTEEQLRELEVQLANMEKRRDRMKNGQGKDLGVAFAKADARFHEALLARVDNVLATALTDLFWANNRAFQRPADWKTMDKMVEKHRKILDALRHGTYADFCEAMRYHHYEDVDDSQY